MRVAVVGGGLFGCTAAAELAREHDVTLLERHADILQGATRAHQARVHRGYHYPRDPHAGELWDRAAEFELRFPHVVNRTMQTHYVIASDPESYRRFTDDARLPWWPGSSALVHDLPHIRVPEVYVDVEFLRLQLRNQLRGARILLGVQADLEQLAGEYDFVVDATYGRYWPEPLRYEVCETVLVKLGPQWTGQGFVVVDGEFCSLDPHGQLHMLYDVAHSVHAVNEIPEHLLPLLDKGVIRTEHTRVDAMLESANRFLNVGPAEYRGSMVTVRAVLPDDGTDARPTLIRADGNIVRVLAGKMVAAPWAAREIARLVRGDPIGEDGPELVSIPAGVTVVAGRA